MSPINHHELLDSYHQPSWLDSSLLDDFVHIFPYDESIIDLMSLHQPPWEDFHHISSFLIGS